MQFDCKRAGLGEGSRPKSPRLGDWGVETIASYAANRRMPYGVAAHKRRTRPMKVSDAVDSSTTIPAAAGGSGSGVAGALTPRYFAGMGRWCEGLGAVTRS